MPGYTSRSWTVGAHRSRSHPKSWKRWNGPWRRSCRELARDRPPPGFVFRPRCYFSPRVQHVLVLNASYEPLNVCSVRRAHVLVYKGKAEVVERLEQPLRSASRSFTWPHVIRLGPYVRGPPAVQRKNSPPAPFPRGGGGGG